MFKQIKNKYFIIFSLITLIYLMSGCAPGKYVLTNPPTNDTRNFKNVEVAKVEVGITESELDPEIPIELRTAIMEEIQKKGIYKNIAAELDVDESTLQIQPKIIEFDKGSQAARYLVGFGAGKAHLDVQCKFINKETEKVFAEGTFTAFVSGGFFGGSTNQKTMSKNVAIQIVKFLQKSR